jgi:hypothetical protein
MTISAEQLRQHVKKQIDVSKIIESIDDSLRRYAMENSIDTAFTITIKRYPGWVVEKICESYMGAGWHSVKVKRQADAFMYLEFVV